jgi:2-keto-3-deoxy-L-rhamnonate aldolase RhmA
MHIVVVEGDGGLCTVLRLLMMETGSAVTGCKDIKTLENVDMVVIGPNSEHVDVEQIEKRHIPFIKIGFSPNIDAVMRLVEHMIEDINKRADRSILEDRAV